MREHLYRGKAIDSGEWVEGYLFIAKENTFILKPVIGDERNGFEFNTVFEDTISEFAGLTDKNGKRIFEGDIVQCIYLKNALCLVEFEDYDLQFKMRKIGDKRGKPFKYYGISYVVIGNKWDNPELLKEV